MKRGGLILALLMAWFAAACTVVVVQVAPGQYDVSLATRAVSTQTTLPSPTASLTATPTATVTPTATLTRTPSPTATAISTMTPQPTGTGAPTQELTPVPTVTPGNTAVPKSCELVVTDTRNVRSGAGVEYAIVGSRAQGSAINVSEFATDSTETYLWGKIGANQWLVVLKWSTRLWWVWTVEDDSCWDVTGYPQELVHPQQRPSEKVAFGWHMVPGGNAGEVSQSLDILQRAGIKPALKSVSDPNMVITGEAHGAVTIYRSVTIPDCPNVSNPNPVNEAQRWAVTLASQWFQLTVKPDYFEVTNECDFQDPAWWTSFGLEIQRQATARGWGRLILPTFAPGHQEQKHAEGMKELWLSMLARGDCVGIHAYGIAPGVWVSNSGAWLGYRHVLFHQWLIAADPRLADLKMCITEVAAGAGNDPVTFADVVQFWIAVQDVPYIELVTWWYAGTPLNAWPQARLDGMLNALAEAVVRALQ